MSDWSLRTRVCAIDDFASEIDTKGYELTTDDLQSWAPLPWKDFPKIIERTWSLVLN